MDIFLVLLLFVLTLVGFFLAFVRAKLLPLCLQFYKVSKFLFEPTVVVHLTSLNLFSTLFELVNEFSNEGVQNLNQKTNNSFLTLEP